MYKEKSHFWQGEWIDDGELSNRLNNFDEYTRQVLAQKFPLEYFLDLTQKFHDILKKQKEEYSKLLSLAVSTHSISREKAKGMLEVLISFLDRQTLEKKLKSELGSIDPFELKRESYREDFFEAWLPMGVLVHIAPTNVFTVGILCIIEGLMSGNINILKTSLTQNKISHIFFEYFLKLDAKNLIKPYIIIAEISSKDKDMLSKVINSADVVSAWGSEEAIKSIKSIANDGIRVVQWGHKISFAYFSKEELNNTEAIKEVCKDICLLDQNACSSPQDVFVESSDFDEVTAFAKTFADILEDESSKTIRSYIDDATQAEISTVINIAKTEEALHLTKVFQARDKSWCVIAERRESLSVSPLFRTIWIKPLCANQIIPKLHPMKSYLQTAALIAPRDRIFEFSKLLFGSGCLRIKSAGHMHDNYTGEPHDGVYALSHFMKRVSCQLPQQLDGISSFNHFEKPYEPDLGKTDIMNKVEFQSMKVENRYIDLTFKSGGSSGKTTYSYYTYKDYHTILQECAKGLFVAGLNPKKDKVLNMFAAGNLYGGFVSFWTILEYLEVAQYPMGIEADLKDIGKLVIEKNINSILSVPSLIVNLFDANKELFKKHKIIKKLFFGGDHFPLNQIKYLKDEFGVELVKAAAYGSNDAGALGYQCPACKSNEYHLLSSGVFLEVFDKDSSKKAKLGDTGRLIFTVKHREGQNIIRYDLGDLGYINDKKCECGREDVKFTLLGRSSDVFKAGGPFLSYGTFEKLLEEGFGYSKWLQITLDEVDTKQRLLLVLESERGLEKDKIKRYLIDHYKSLKLSMVELGMIFEIKFSFREDFEVVVHSGKVKHLIDKRNI